MPKATAAPKKTAAKAAKKPAAGATAAPKKKCTHWSDCGAADSKCVKNKCVLPKAGKTVAK
jgi:hypothetical protein